MKVLVNSNCIGCGLCESVCPEVFEMNDEGLAQAINEPVPDAAESTAQEALESCPVEAIEEVEGE